MAAGSDGQPSNVTIVAEPLEELSLRIIYQCQRFDPPTIGRILLHFKEMLESFLSDPAGQIGNLPLLKRQEIAIAATFTAEPVKESLAFWMQRLDTPTAIQFSPYGQVFQQLLDPSSSLGRQHAGSNAILVRLDDWGNGTIGPRRNTIKNRGRQ